MTDRTPNVNVPYEINNEVRTGKSLRRLTFAIRHSRSTMGSGRYFFWELPNIHNKQWRNEKN